MLIYHQHTCFGISFMEVLLSLPVKLVMLMFIIIAVYKIQGMLIRTAETGIWSGLTYPILLPQPCSRTGSTGQTGIILQQRNVTNTLEPISQFSSIQHIGQWTSMCIIHSNKNQVYLNKGHSIIVSLFVAKLNFVPLTI